MIETSRKTIDKVNTYQPGYFTSTRSLACKLLIVMMILSRIQGYSVLHCPLCGFLGAMPRPQSFVEAPTMWATRASPLRYPFRTLVK